MDNGKTNKSFIVQGALNEIIICERLLNVTSFYLIPGHAKVKMNCFK
jgi:hypothetical protein